MPEQLRPFVQPPGDVAPAPEIRMRRTAAVQMRLLSEDVRPKGQPQQTPNGRAQKHFGRDEHVLRGAVRQMIDGHNSVRDVIVAFISGHLYIYYKLTRASAYRAYFYVSRSCSNVTRRSEY